METVDKLYLELSTITNAFSESDQLGVDLAKKVLRLNHKVIDECGLGIDYEIRNMAVKLLKTKLSNDGFQDWVALHQIKHTS